MYRRHYYEIFYAVWNNYRPISYRRQNSFPSSSAENSLLSSSSVWGMVLLFVLLCLKVIKLDQIEETADFLLSIMTITFVPVGASLITSFPAIKDEIVGIFAIIIISTVVCFFITGKVAQKIIDSINKNKGEE